MNKKMTIGLISVFIVILFASLYWGLTTMKPIHFNVFAGCVVVIATFFALFGKKLQDESSSNKSDKMIATGESTEQKVIRLQTTIDEQATTIDSLRKENTDLHAKLAAKSIEIFNVAKKGVDVSLAGFNEQRENFVKQNRPVLEVGKFDIGNPRQEFLKYEIKNININPAQIIWVVHGVTNNKPDLKAPPSNIKVFEGKKMFRPPHGSRHYPQHLRSVFVVNGYSVPSGVSSPSLRSPSPWYFVGQIYYFDQVTERVFDYMFCVELTEVKGELKAVFLRNDPPIEIPYRPIKPGVDEPNASFDYYLDLAK